MERDRELFYQIADAIEQNPSNHQQSTWMTWDTYMDDYRAKDVSELNSLTVNGEVIEGCGTTQCVAGWAWTLAGRGRELAKAMLEGSTSEGIMQPAACALGITDDEAEVLFISSAGHTRSYDWPQVLRDLGDGKDMEQAFRDNHVAGELEIPVSKFDRLNRTTVTTP